MSMTSNNRGLSLVELMVGTAILTIVFGGTFTLLSKLRKVSAAQNNSGPHLFFETFATARLKLYFSKLMQWTSQMNANVNTPGDFNDKCDADPKNDTARLKMACRTENTGRFCEQTSQFAYATGESSFNFAPTSAMAERTLGADLRMAASTFDYEFASKNSLVGIYDQDFTDKDGKPTGWGAMVPFSGRDRDEDGINRINPNFSKFCDTSEFKPTSGVGAEMCAWVDVCSAQQGNRTAEPPPSPNPTADGIPILAFDATGSGDVQGLENLSAANPAFRMCFVFVGNLFSKTGIFVQKSAAGTTDSSTGVEAIDNPSVLGLAVATARFVNTKTGQPLTCKSAVNEMYRSMKVTVELYTALNADQTVSSQKQIFYRSTKEITSEKLGVPITNCNIPSKGVLTNGAGQKICIADPIWNYRCEPSCANPE